MTDENETIRLTVEQQQALAELDKLNQKIRELFAGFDALGKSSPATVQLAGFQQEVSALRKELSAGGLSPERLAQINERIAEISSGLGQFSDQGKKAADSAGSAAGGFERMALRLIILRELLPAVKDALNVIAETIEASSVVTDKNAGSITIFNDAWQNFKNGHYVDALLDLANAQIAIHDTGAEATVQEQNMIAAIGVRIGAVLREVGSLDLQVEAEKRVIATMKERGQLVPVVIEAEIARIDALAKVYEKLHGGPSAALAELRESLIALARDGEHAVADMDKVLGLETPEAVVKASNALDRYIEQISLSGTVTIEQADKIVAAAQRQVIAIEALPPKEQAALDQRRLHFQAIVAEYEKFTDDYRKRSEQQVEYQERTAKEEAKILEEREKRLDAFSLHAQQTLDAAAAKARDAENAAEAGITKKKPGGDAAQQAADLDKLKAERDALDAKPSKTVEELNKQFDLENQIADLEQQRASVSDQISANIDGSGKALATFDTILKSVFGNERELKDLTEEQRSLLAGVVDQYRSEAEALDRAGQAFSSRDIEAFKTEVVSIIPEMSKFQVLGNNTADTAAHLAENLRQGSEAASEVAAEVPPASEAVDGFSTSVERGADGVLRIVTTAKPAAEGLKDVGDKAAEAKPKLDDVGKAAGDAGDKGAKGVHALNEELRITKSLVIEILPLFNQLGDAAGPLGSQPAIGP